MTALKPLKYQNFYQAALQEAVTQYENKASILRDGICESKEVLKECNWTAN
jgi:cation transport regulator ChaB